jgi:hypothetical protein
MCGRFNLFTKGIRGSTFLASCVQLQCLREFHYQQIS